MTGRLFRRSGQLVELLLGGVNRSRVTVSLPSRVSRITRNGLSFSEAKGLDGYVITV